SANSGLCTQVCRWEMQLVEKSRPNQQFQIEEDERGSYILNSRDLNLICRIPELVAAGITSAKIEGRMKSLYYAANTARIYKAAIHHAKAGTPLPQKLVAELDSVTHRVYSEGFYNGFDAAEMQDFEKAQYIRTHTYIGAVLQANENFAQIEVRNKFVSGDKLEIIFPNPKEDQTFTVTDILNLEREKIVAAQPNMTVLLPLEAGISAHGLLRRADNLPD
ncbi:MAG: U32 family peptidase C-terminal domain-containing protein, partial [Candidatus Cloacimonetes bacterium]|nr:U32 family peptidase C-terminal domain-containing protein [Candidatus Cloacimonadota bacterium]